MIYTMLIGGGLRVNADLAFTTFAWLLLGIFLVATMFWLIEMLIIGRAPRPPLEHGLEDIQIRIITIDAERVVQATVASLPERVADVHVIAEAEIQVPQASVHIVPEDFGCEATRKARAVEWARRNVTCDATFVCYLDEDTLVRDLPRFPDADIVQLSERPIRSDSWVAYFAEIFRMGFQLEQAVFPSFRYPLYAWGGGFAVKKELEDAVTWNVNTVTEDTNFIWRAFSDPTVEMAFHNVKLRNQAPPSIREMVHQRRRWISGSLNDIGLLPLRYRVLAIFRNVAWALVFVSPLLALPLIFPVSNLVYPFYYRVGIAIQLVGLFGWAFLGYWYYAERVRVLIALFLTIPFVAIAHSAGAFWALIRPVKQFRVTKKVQPKEVSDDQIDDFESLAPDSSRESE